jgi:mono/diheme cytochrome c family protein
MPRFSAAPLVSIYGVGRLSEDGIMRGLFLLLLASAAAASVAAAEPIDFNRQVRPILSANCFKCHGPDDKARQAGLRLDLQDAAIKELESGATAIVPGKVDVSELVRRIFAEDENERMPPLASNKKLTDEQRQILKQWVGEGARYDPHWAFVPPKQAVPPVAPVARNAIDAFIHFRLSSAGLPPSNEADRYVLARRASLDLIGLPPTPEEADAFVSDPAPDAYERMIDRLLASPHYGERWARRWLDLARYADTNGYEKDRVRNMWPYRDWVIRALNCDMPFDQFTVEQLAGDMLPGATIDQRIATGFHRNTMLNEEGGIDPLEFRFYAMVDRANTTATVWMGLTLGCAQCHTHKFDPIPHADYYKQFAFLNNADEPTIEIPQPDLVARRADIERRIAEITADLPNRFPPEGDLKWHTPKPASFVSAGGASGEIRADGSVLLSGTNPATDTYTLVIDTPAGEFTSLRLEALVDPALPSTGPGRTKHGNFVLSEVALEIAPQSAAEKREPIKLARAEADFSQEQFPAAHAIDGNTKTGWAIHGPGKWNVNRTLTLHFDKPVAVNEPARWTIKIDQQHGTEHTLGCLRISLAEPVKDDRPPEVRRRAHLEKKFQAWLTAEREKTVKWIPLKPLAAKSVIPTLSIQDDGSIFVSGDMSKRDVYDIALDAGGLTGITALRLETITDERLPQNGPGRIYYEGPFGDFFLSRFTLNSAVGNAVPGVPPASPLKFASASHSFANANNTAAMAIDDDPQTGWSISGGQGRPHYAVFQLEKPLEATDQLQLQMLFERYYAAGLGRFRIWATNDPKGGQARDLPNEIEELLLLPPDQLSPEQNHRLLAQFVQVAPELAPEREAIKKLRDSLPAYPTALVMQQRSAGQTRATFVHHRGEFLQPKDEVTPGLLQILAPQAKHSPQDRLEYARWLVSTENPLVGRVTVNRHWTALFGTGIVRTTEDFGYQGDPPSHPELLDWLAVELPRRDWSIKSLHRLLVTSATYRQSSHVTADQPAKDPQNRLLSHFPRTRLEAELVRDSALQVSGLLSEKIGGPSVFPVQPASVTTEGAYGGLGWNVSPGEDRYRRGLYTFSKRTAPFAMFATFDAPSGEACVARREISNTPLQALTMLNEPTLVEAAQVLGAKAATSGRGSTETTTDLFRRCLTRPPSEQELLLLVKYYQTQKQRLVSKELDAEKIAGPGDGDAIERAAWTLMSRTILNLDEAITKE